MYSHCLLWLIKSWRKKLGNERRAKIKLENELEKAKEEKLKDSGIVDPEDEPKSLANSPTNNPFEICCTICAEPIEDYVPVYFQETEMNPACLNCQDSSITWELRSTPPGIPTSTSTPTSMVTQMSPKATQMKASVYVTEDIVDADHEVNILRKEVRSKGKAKLEAMFRNGEWVIRNLFDDLEEEAVKELENKLAEDFYYEKKLLD